MRCERMHDPTPVFHDPFKQVARKIISRFESWCEVEITCAQNSRRFEIALT